MSDEKRLLEFKERIESAKTQQAEVKGQIMGIENQMHTQFNVKDIPSAKKKVEKIETKLEALNKQFSEGMQKLEQAMEVNHE